MDRLAFFPVTIVIVLIAVYLHLTFVSVAILGGIVIPLFGLISGKDIFASTATGYLCSLLGIALLICAYLICNHYGISFAKLDSDRSFPRLVRRLPYYGITLLSTAATTFAISIFRKRPTY
jgi:hypothetical protein